MSKVRIINNLAVEIIPETATVPSIAHWYGADFAVQCVDAPDDVRQGMYYDAETGQFTEMIAVNLSEIKANRIAETKTALEAYLAEHPLRWTDGKYYSITAEKQTLLANTLAVYQIAVSAGQTPQLTWNATGEECAAWAYADLCALALGIAATVKPLVAHQQALEMEIQAASTVDELDGVVIDYAAVT